MDQRLLRILGGETTHYPYALEEKFPRIFGQIMALWDAPEMDDYFMKLIVDQRGGRAGFPPLVAAEILHLSLVHAAQHKNRTAINGWDVSDDAFVNFNLQGGTAQQRAWQAPSEAMRMAIQKLGGHCSLEGFLKAAELGNRALVGLFLEGKVDIESRNEQGWTALMLAAFNGHDAIETLLIQQGADVFSSDSGGNTALHWAAFSGHVECAKQLLIHHADVNSRSAFGWTPLLQATARRHLEVLLLLINHGANLNIAARDGETPLHKAAAAGYIEIMRPLLAQQANTTMKNLAGETAMQLAMNHHQNAAVRLLLNTAH